MNPAEARRLAEKSFKHTQPTPNGRPTKPGYEADAITTRAKTARLKDLRLVKERGAISDDR